MTRNVWLIYTSPQRKLLGPQRCGSSPTTISANDQTTTVPEVYHQQKITLASIYITTHHHQRFIHHRFLIQEYNLIS
jgi:hypothetical protein